MVFVLTILAALPLSHWLARLADLNRRRRSPYRVRPGQYRPDGEGPQVSVLIPARDEEHNIQACLRSVLAQDHPNLRVVVLDDRSQDRTAEIVDRMAEEDGRLRRLEGVELPAGWKGKCHALHQAAAVADGEWLLFVDADVVLEPGALTAALGLARDERADMVSWFGRLQVVTLWERVLQPFIHDFIVTHSDPARVNDLARPECIANGQFILIRATVYRDLGGHEAVRDSIVEDMALSRLVKGAGYRYRLAEGFALMTTRMYGSFGEIWGGWTKNFYAGLHGRKDVVAASVVYLLLTGVTPFVLLGTAIGLAAAGSLHLGLLIVSAASVAALLGYRLAAIRITSPPSLLSVLLHPIEALLLVVIILESARRAASGTPVVWKGRPYDAGGRSAEMPDR